MLHLPTLQPTATNVSSICLSSILNHARSQAEVVALSKLLELPFRGGRRLADPTSAFLVRILRSSSTVSDTERVHSAVQHCELRNHTLQSLYVLWECSREMNVLLGVPLSALAAVEFLITEKTSHAATCRLIAHFGGNQKLLRTSPYRPPG